MTDDTATSTSPLGGSALVIELDSTTDDLVSAATAASSGAFNHDTGGITLDDGTYLFVDADGSNATGFLADAGPYDYVRVFSLEYSAGGKDYFTFGLAGVITGASDMPTAGSASYTGVADVQLTQLNPAESANNLLLGDGVSTIDVDFSAGTAGVTLGSFTDITDGDGTTIAAATAAFDQVQGTGLLISGPHFTAGTWVTNSNCSVVNAVGASPTSTSNGTFFGYDTSISAPDEVGGVLVISGGSATVLGLYVAD